MSQKNYRCNNVEEDNFNISINDMDTEQQQSGISKLICEYKSYFAKHKYDNGTVKSSQALITRKLNRRVLQSFCLPGNFDL